MNVDSDMVCAVYARYSSDLQRDRSIDDQLAACRAYAAAQGWAVAEAHVYADRAVSGASLVGRHGLQALLRTAEQTRPPFNYVLCDDTSRLSRADGEVSQIVQRLRFYGVHFVFVSQGIDTANPDSNMVLGIHNVVDSQYRVDLARKTLRGLKGCVERGLSAGGRLYGYRSIRELDPSGAIDPKTGQVRVLGSRIEIDPEEAAIVRQIFGMYARGLSFGDIARYLNAHQIDPPRIRRQIENGRKRATWGPSTLRHTIDNPRYAGELRYNTRTVVKHPVTGERRAVENDPREWVVRERPDLAIVDRETWREAQRRIEENRRQPQRGQGARSSHLFSGLMKCHECGGSYVPVLYHSTSDPAFGCATFRQRGSSACANNFKVRKSELETVILGHLRDGYLSPPVLAAIVSRANEIVRGKLSEIRRQSAGSVEERRDIARRMENILDAIEAGAAVEPLRERYAALAARSEDLNRRQEEADRALDSDRFRIDEGEIQAWLDNLTALAATDPMQAKALFMPLVGQFELSPKIIEGVKYLRVKGNARISGLLAVATGSNKSENGGAFC